MSEYKPGAQRNGEELAPNSKLPDHFTSDEEDLLSRINVKCRIYDCQHKSSEAHRLSFEAFVWANDYFQGHWED